MLLLFSHRIHKWFREKHVPLNYVDPGDIQYLVKKVESKIRIHADNEIDRYANSSLNNKKELLLIDPRMRKSSNEGGMPMIEDLLIPSAARFYLEPSSLSVDTSFCTLDFVVDTSFFKKLHKPFYFKKTEVTNAEYRSFVAYVKDSLFRELLADSLPDQFPKKEGFLNLELEIDWSDSVVRELFRRNFCFPEHLQFYRRWEIDARKLIYGFNNGLESVCVMLDTNSWYNDFGWSFNESLANHYAWHPYYDLHPGGRDHPMASPKPIVIGWKRH